MSKHLNIWMSKCVISPDPGATQDIGVDKREAAMRDNIVNFAVSVIEAAPRVER